MILSLSLRLWPRNENARWHGRALVRNGAGKLVVVVADSKNRMAAYTELLDKARHVDLVDRAARDA